MKNTRTGYIGLPHRMYNMCIFYFVQETYFRFSDDSIVLAFFVSQNNTSQVT